MQVFHPPDDPSSTPTVLGVSVGLLLGLPAGAALGGVLAFLSIILLSMAMVFAVV